MIASRHKVNYWLNHRRPQAAPIIPSIYSQTICFFAALNLATELPGQNEHPLDSFKINAI
jgi:hypothetical protein